MANICVFGDSTAWGAWDLEKGGWVNCVWLHLAKADPHAELYNLSISGGTTTGILSRFESEANAREADVLIFQTGGNDSSIRANGQPKVDPDQFRQNITEILQRAKTITDKIVFLGYKNVDEAKTTPVSWADVSYTNDQIKKYNEIIKTVCAEEHVPFLELFGLLEPADFEDGLHPNTSGHQKIFDAVIPFLRKEKLIP